MLVVTMVFQGMRRGQILPPVPRHRGGLKFRLNLVALTSTVKSVDVHALPQSQSFGQNNFGLLPSLLKKTISEASEGGQREVNGQNSSRIGRDNGHDML